MERLGGDVARELARFGPQARFGKLVERWPAAVGASIARNAWPARIQRDGTLVVHASSSAWVFELTHLEATIKERLGDLTPPRLRFVPGPLPEADRPSSAKATPTVSEVTSEEAAQGSEIAAAIGDEELRILVARAAAASLARARSDRSF
jgi:Dna[CI] antecedent, DciA